MSKTGSTTKQGRYKRMPHFPQQSNVNTWKIKQKKQTQNEPAHTNSQGERVSEQRGEESKSDVAACHCSSSANCTSFNCYVTHDLTLKSRTKIRDDNRFHHRQIYNRTLQLIKHQYFQFFSQCLRPAPMGRFESIIQFPEITFGHTWGTRENVLKKARIRTMWREESKWDGLVTLPLASLGLRPKVSAQYCVIKWAKKK